MSLTSAQEGAFDESVKGVDAIAHMASPINNHFNHFDDECYNPYTMYCQYSPQLS